MDKLNYEALEKLTRTKRHHLEFVEIDATRLRDDRSEIRSGDEVAFVATAKLRLTRDGLSYMRSELPECKALLKELAEGDDLLEIGNDAEIESPLPIDLESVKQWLADHYAFTFLLDGDDCDLFRSIGRHDSALPWAKTLNTGIVRNDHFDVGVRIDHHTPPPPPAPPPLPPGTRTRITLASAADVAVELDDAVLQLRLAVEGPYDHAHELKGKTFWIPMHPEHDDVRLVVTIREVSTKNHDKPGEPAKKSQDRNR